MALTLMPLPTHQFFDTDGTPLSGGLLYAYQPGTLSPKPTYVDYTGTAYNTNPVVLDSAGRCKVWLDGAYHMRLFSATGILQWDIDNIVSGDQVQFSTLQTQINLLSEDLDEKAGLSSPEFTGVPTVPTPSTINDSKQIANTEFVHNLVDENVTGITYVGQVAFFAMPSAPSGWLVCDGAAVSRTTYNNLFALIGTTFGNGDGVNTFNVPDLRNKYITGWDTVKTFGSDEQLSTTGTDGPESIILNPCIKA